MGGGAQGFAERALRPDDDLGVRPLRGAPAPRAVRAGGALARARPHGEADAGDAPARAPSPRSLAAPARDVAPPGGGEDAAPRVGRSGGHHGDGGRAARGRGRPPRPLPARGSARGRARLLRPPPREDALAEGGGGLFTLPQAGARAPGG